jgi:hypothetical protein
VKEIKLKCPTCNGRGSVALPEHLRNVLHSILRGKETSEEIYADLREKITRAIRKQTCLNWPCV